MFCMVPHHRHWYICTMVQGHKRLASDYGEDRLWHEHAVKVCISSKLPLQLDWAMHQIVIVQSPKLWWLQILPLICLLNFLASLQTLSHALSRKIASKSRRPSILCCLHVHCNSSFLLDWELSNLPTRLSLNIIKTLSSCSWIALWELQSWDPYPCQAVRVQQSRNKAAIAISFVTSTVD